MDIKEAVGAVMREYLIPELEAIKAGQLRADVEFSAINKRLDDVNQHLVDQSRRIDAVREELGQRIDTSNERIDAVREELGQRIDTNNERIDETNSRIDTSNERIAATDTSLGRLYEVIVRREEHSAVIIKLNELELDVRELKQRFAT